MKLETLVSAACLDLVSIFLNNCEVSSSAPVGLSTVGEEKMPLISPLEHV